MEKIQIQANIIQEQQKFCKITNRKEREANVLMFVVPEEGESRRGYRRRHQD